MTALLRQWALPSLGLIILSAVFGWLSASGRGHESGEVRDHWDDQAVQAVTLPASAYKRLARSVRDTGLMANQKQGQEAQRKAGREAALSPDDPNYVPPFPDVLSVSVIDGQTVLHMRDKDKGLINARAGDVVADGWMLDSVSPKRVMAVYKDKRREFLIEYSGVIDGEDRDGNQLSADGQDIPPPVPAVPGRSPKDE